MRKACYALWLLLGLGALAFAEERPDFNGNWTLVQTAGTDHGTTFSEGAGEGDYGLLITHSGNRILLESICAICDRSVQEFITDGIAREMPHNFPGLLIAYIAKWDNEKFILDRTVGGDTSFGTAMSSSHEAWTLSADKEILTRYCRTKDSRGLVEQTLVYQKVK